MTGIIAHRGMPLEAPENTMSAFRRAVEVGADGIELDVYLTRDNKLIVMHDNRLDRTTTGKGSIYDYDSAYLRELDAGVKFSPEFAGEKIPFLEEVFDLIKSAGMFINVEIKSMPWYPKGVERAVVDMVKAFDLEDRCIISNFDHTSLMEVKRLSGNIKTAALYGNNLCKPWDYAKNNGIDALHPGYFYVDALMIQQSHEAGIMVNPYTVNNPEDIAFLIKQGIDNIITDDAAVAIRVRDGLKHE